MSSQIQGDLDMLSEKLLGDLQAFADFIEAETVEYEDKGNQEVLLITKHGRAFSIMACGNRTGKDGYVYE